MQQLPRGVATDMFTDKLPQSRHILLCAQVSLLAICPFHLFLSWWVDRICEGLQDTPAGCKSLCASLRVAFTEAPVNSDKLLESFWRDVAKTEIYIAPVLLKDIGVELSVDQLLL